MCPVCRVVINSNQLQRFSLRTSTADPAAGAPPIIRNNEVIPRSLRQIDYNCIPPSLLEDIQTMESIGSYGSKIDTLTRHLLYLKVAEPDAKSIVFSAWADSLLSELYLTFVTMLTHSVLSSHSARLDSKRLVTS